MAPKRFTSLVSIASVAFHVRPDLWPSIGMAGGNAMIAGETVFAKFDVAHRLAGFRFGVWTGTAIGGIASVVVLVILGAPYPIAKLAADLCPLLVISGLCTGMLAGFAPWHVHRVRRGRLGGWAAVVIALCVLNGGFIMRREGLCRSLIAAVQRGDAVAVAGLLASGADVETRDYYGERGEDDNPPTALMVAATNGDSNMVKLLVANGADPNARDDSGETPMSVARFNRNKQIIGLMPDRKAH